MSELPSANHENMSEAQAQEAAKLLAENVIRIASRTLDETNSSDSRSNEEGHSGQSPRRIGSRVDYEGPWGVARNDLSPWIEEWPYPEQVSTAKADQK